MRPSLAQAQLSQRAAPHGEQTPVVYKQKASDCFASVWHRRISWGHCKSLVREIEICDAILGTSCMKRARARVESPEPVEIGRIFSHIIIGGTN